jgi:5-formyltetrahydrofolate cyclo-ligase
VLLPVLLPGRDLDWCRAGDGVAPGPHGLLEPTRRGLGRDEIAACTLVVVPALAVDRTGNRSVGGGARTTGRLARTSAWVVALLHDGEAVPALPAEPHDRPVSAFVTRRPGLVTVGTGRRTACRGQMTEET